VLDRIVEILVDKLFRPTSAAERAEGRAKDNLVFVHEALVQCHRSFVAYSGALDEKSHAIWRSDVLKLAQCINNARTVLATFGQAAYNEVVEYAFAESVAPAISPQVQQRMAVEAALAVALEELTLLRSEDHQYWSDSVVKVAAKLRETIAKQLTPGEVQRAQDAFRKKNAETLLRR
jgi:hypothetical protein